MCPFGRKMDLSGLKKRAIRIPRCPQNGGTAHFLPCEKNTVLGAFWLEGSKSQGCGAFRYLAVFSKVGLKEVERENAGRVVPWVCKVFECRVRGWRVLCARRTLQVCLRPFRESERFFFFFFFFASERKESESGGI